MFRICLIVLLVMPSTSWAGTVERVLRLQLEETSTFPVDQPVRVHVDDPEILGAVQLESMEVRLEARSAGTTLVFLHGRGGVTAWRVLVDHPIDRAARETAIQAARAACGSLEQNANGLEVRVHSAACHAAVLELTSHVLSTEISLRFDETGLRAQLAAQQARLAEEHHDLAATVTLAYMGGTLLVLGRVPSQADADAAVRSLWRATAGRMLVDVERLALGSAPARRR